MRDRLLSPHFALSELVATSTAERNDPDDAVIACLASLCRDVLEPLRERFGPLHVNSGYRSLAVNSKIGGAVYSAHLYGCAADVRSVRGATPTEMLAWLKTAGLPIDQAIDELAGTAHWLHVGIVRPLHGAARGQYLQMRIRGGIKVYSAV